MNACWNGVASRDHVRLAAAGGFAQLHHGRRTALDRLIIISRDAPIEPLLGDLSVTSDRTRWGTMFRHDAFRIEAEDERIMATAMKAVE